MRRLWQVFCFAEKPRRATDAGTLRAIPAKSIILGQNIAPALKGPISPLQGFHHFGRDEVAGYSRALFRPALRVLPEPFSPARGTALPKGIPMAKARTPAGKIAVFPGTFDPITLGHLDIVDRGRRLFDHLILAIGINPEKDHLLPPEERLQLARELVKPFRNVTAEAYTGLTVQFVQQKGAMAIIRGLRNLSDMDYEFRAALTNRKVAGVETVFIMTREEFGFTSSSLIKQIVTMGGDPRKLRELLPEVVIQRLLHYRDNHLGGFGKKPKDSVTG